MAFGFNRLIHVYLMPQRKEPLTWTESRTYALSARESQTHPAMSLAIPAVQVSRHGILSACQVISNSGEI